MGGVKATLRIFPDACLHFFSQHCSVSLDGIDNLPELSRNFGRLPMVKEFKIVGL